MNQISTLWGHFNAEHKPHRSAKALVQYEVSRIGYNRCAATYDANLRRIPERVLDDHLRT